MSRFESLMAEAAIVTANHGFAEDEVGETTYGGSWYGLVRFNRTTLLNIGEDAISREIADDTTYLCIVEESNDGFVGIVDWADELDVGRVDLVESIWRELGEAQSETIEIDLFGGEDT